MLCQKCNSDGIIQVSAKTDDRFCMNTTEGQYNGYVPFDIGLGGGDYINFRFCPNCGQIQGEFPVNGNTDGVSDDYMSDGYGKYFND